MRGLTPPRRESVATGALSPEGVVEAAAALQEGQSGAWALACAALCAAGVHAPQRAAQLPLLLLAGAGGMVERARGVWAWRQQLLDLQQQDASAEAIVALFARDGINRRRCARTLLAPFHGTPGVWAASARGASRRACRQFERVQPWLMRGADTANPQHVVISLCFMSRLVRRQVATLQQACAGARPGEVPMLEAAVRVAQRHPDIAGARALTQDAQDGQDVRARAAMAAAFLVACGEPIPGLSPVDRAWITRASERALQRLGEDLDGWRWRRLRVLEGVDQAVQSAQRALVLAWFAVGDTDARKEALLEAHQGLERDRQSLRDLEVMLRRP